MYKVAASPTVPGTISIMGDTLIFEVRGIDEILAIKHTLEVPLEHVTYASAEDTNWQVFQAMKVAGARIPGVVMDGRFLSKDGLVFFDMHHPDKCVTVGLDHETYTKIIFEVEDKERTAEMINDALAQRK